jgi:hypothetical protein
MSFPFLGTMSFQTPIFLFLYSFNLFFLLILFSKSFLLGMHSLHRTWGDDLFVSEQSS